MTYWYVVAEEGARADEKPPFKFDRYVRGALMAEGVYIGRQTTLADAMQEAARLAEKGPNGEVPVLVYRPSALCLAASDALREALAECQRWHEREDKALSKSGRGDADYYWRRGEHKREIERISVVLAHNSRGEIKSSDGGSFQSRIQPWMIACFGEQIAADKIERNYRFLEEALELVQACGCTQYEAHQLVDYVYGRPQGDINQEVGGVMVTLAALCLANGFDMHAAAEKELARIWTNVEQIRAKQAAKPKHSPLPGPSDPQPDPGALSEASVDEIAALLGNVIRERHGLRPLSATEIDGEPDWHEQREQATAILSSGLVTVAHPDEAAGRRALAEQEGTSRG
jgi:hypothetical protein